MNTFVKCPHSNDVALFSDPLQFYFNLKLNFIVIPLKYLINCIELHLCYCLN